MENILYERVKTLCTESGITVNRLEVELGFAPSTIQKWKSSTSPSVAKVKAVASYFNVSLDYLIGTSDIKDTAENILQDKQIISLQRARQQMSKPGRAWTDEILGTFIEGYFKNKEDDKQND